MYIRRFAFVTIWLLATISSSALAQDSGGIAADVGLGPSRGGHGGIRHSRESIAISGMLSWTAATRASLVYAVAAATHVRPWSTTLDCLSIPDGGCASDFPDIHSLGVMGGVRAPRGATGASLRLLAGPAAFLSNEGSAFGLQGRADVSTPYYRRVALTAWTQGSVIPRLAGQHFQTGELGLGLRVH